MSGMVKMIAIAAALLYLGLTVGTWAPKVGF